MVVNRDENDFNWCKQLHESRDSEVWLTTDNSDIGFLDDRYQKSAASVNFCDRVAVPAAHSSSSVIDRSGKIGNSYPS